MSDVEKGTRPALLSQSVNVTATPGHVRPDVLPINVQSSAPSWTHPADKFWSTYLEDAEKQDHALAESWKGDTDGILIFVRVNVL